MRRCCVGALALGFCLVAMEAAGLVRQPNTTLKLPQNPGRFGFRLVDALGMSFDIPVRVVFPPGETNRVFVLEQRGIVVVVTNLAAPTRTVFLDLTDSTYLGPEEGLVSLAFHPRYASNGRFFIHRVVRQGPGTTALRFNQVSEFRVAPDDPARADAASERPLIRQQYIGRNHYGGDLHFGRDGYLYGSCGDGYFPRVNSQQIDQGFFSALWRIDVDERSDSLPPNPHPSVVGAYRVPPDNPYVGATSFLGKPVDPSQVRTEFWSVGLRNPFRFSLDPETSDVWVGDVGFETYESVCISPKGANHGWPEREGVIPGIFPGLLPDDFLTNPVHRYTPPLFSYSHADGHCVLGGVVYRGSRFSSLYGYYLFADHSFGWVTALKHNPDGSTDLVSLGYQPGVTSVEVNEATDDVWFSEISQNRVWKLVYSGVFTGDRLPATLRETGAFSNLETLEPNPGIVAYSVNQSFWSDGAQKRRWFSVPKLEDHVEFQSEGAWQAPAGTVWIKHFDLELTNGVPESARRLETRFLVRNTNGIYGVTYRWTSSNDAELVPEEGLKESIPVVENGVRTLREWKYPSRGECLTCHTRAAGLSLSFNAAQLNRAGPWSAVDGNQIHDLRDAGYFKTPPPSVRPLPALASATRSGASLEWRARSYLAANCSGCHRPGGTGLGLFDARLETSTALNGMVDGTLLAPGADPLDRVIAPGKPEHSVLLRRLSTRGPGQMPPLASAVADAGGADLIREWILSLATPDPDSPAVVRPIPDEGGYRLHIAQPANRRLRIERANTLSPPVWEILDVPGTEWAFPSGPEELEVPVTAGPESGFFRITTLAP